MTVLVTGGAGFVGVHIVAALAQRGPVLAADVRPWDDAARRWLAPVAHNVEFAMLDVRDAGKVAGLVREEHITQLVHAAAITATADEERARAAEVVGVNLVGAVNALNAALAAPALERVLLISSSGLYGAPPAGHTAPLPETFPLQLDNLYAITKHSTELLAARYAVLSGKPMAALRLPSIYGPLERPSASRPFVSTLGRLMAALRAGRAITVAGPAVMRDWTYAADAGLAVANLLAAPAWRHSVYNGGNGEALAFGAAVAEFARYGLQATWVQAEADVTMAAEQARAPLDITRLREDAGYAPRYDLAAGVREWLEREL